MSFKINVISVHFIHFPALCSQQVSLPVEYLRVNDAAFLFHFVTLIFSWGFAGINDAWKYTNVLKGLIHLYSQRRFPLCPA